MGLIPVRGSEQGRVNCSSFGDEHDGGEATVTQDLLAGHLRL